MQNEVVRLLRSHGKEATRQTHAAGRYPGRPLLSESPPEPPVTIFGDDDCDLYGVMPGTSKPGSTGGAGSAGGAGGGPGAGGNGAAGARVCGGLVVRAGRQTGGRPAGHEVSSGLGAHKLPPQRWTAMPELCADPTPPPPTPPPNTPNPPQKSRLPIPPPPNPPW
jgi:hypothetical protein